MKVFAVNASPFMEKGNTGLLLAPFLDGMKEEGADVDLVYVRKLHVKPCLGELSCWTKTPGKCIQDDDVRALLPKFQEADVIVFATPVYVDGMPGSLKNLIDRIVPTVEPYFELRDGHCRHPPRQPGKRSKVVLVSTCGFWEMDNFDPLVMHMKAICKNACWEYTGALLRPHGDALGYMVENGPSVEDVLTAAKNAGRELAKTGRLGEENLKVVSRELCPLELYVKMVNRGFKQEIDRHAHSQKA